MPRNVNRPLVVPTFRPTVAGSTQPVNDGVGVGAGVGATVGANSGAVVGNEVGAVCTAGSAGAARGASLPVQAAETIAVNRTNANARRNDKMSCTNGYDCGASSAASTSDHSA